MHMQGSMGYQRFRNQCGCERYMANKNDGHPSYDHGLKRNTFLADLHWSALRTDFHPNLSTYSLWGQLSDDVWSTPSRSELPSRVSC